jgi:phosphoribosyl-ATP pyrophosphohydrolase
MADGVVLPVIVTIEGVSESAALMNKKSYSKSIETKKLWIVHPETGRILPWAGEPDYISLEDAEHYYRVLLPEGSDSKGFELSPSKDDPEIHQNTLLGAEKESDSMILYKLADTIKKRKKLMPSGSYTTHLFEKGMEKIKKKVGEEAIELILAVSKEDIVYESADLIYHLLVLLEEGGVPFHDLMVELERRDS